MKGTIGTTTIKYLKNRYMRLSIPAPCQHRGCRQNAAVVHAFFNSPGEKSPDRLRDSAGTGRLRVALALAFLLLALPGHAQDIEPRRWSHLPIGSNFLGAAYAYTTGDIFLDPVLKIEDAQFNLHTVAAKYIRSFELLGKSARIDFIQPWQSGRWTGLLNGVPASVERDGLGGHLRAFRREPFRRTAARGQGVRRIPRADRA